MSMYTTLLASLKNTAFADVLEFLQIYNFPEIVPDNLFPPQYSSVSDKSKYIIECTEFTHYKEANESVQSNDQLSDCIELDSVQCSEIKLSKDPFLITWNGKNDPEIPYNWSNFKKCLTVGQLLFASWISYTTSSIYVPGQDDIEKDFNCSHVVGTLNLSMFVLGYGIAPMILSPLSEVAFVGRQPIFVWTFFIFTFIQLGCATVNNIVGLIILRFFSGVFCSPLLTHAGASIFDCITEKYSMIMLASWSFCTVLAPVTAPLLGACMTVAKNWRWIFWFLFFISGFATFLLLFTLPETSHTAILSRRARRIRKQTCDSRYYTIQEKIDSKMKISEFLIDTLYRPICMIVQDPIVLAFDLYLSVVYGVFNLFFEAFPIVFIDVYHFSLIELGLSYMGYSVGAATAFITVVTFTYKVVNSSRKNGTFTPEIYLLPPMYFSWFLPLALFLFGWGSAAHWIIPIISEAFFLTATESLFQATFSYFAESYPNHIASSYAGNGLMRCFFAFAFPLFGKAMYNKLAIKGYPVAWGSSLLGFITIALAVIPFALYKYGPALRARSKFAD
ncbi:hypothetical protein RI543_002050 [Arxiozyma heterogenica]|uniref:Major facilitator superfamily (MFS) profile domain-containing protein n=1 Tax=Arxiozyma heterogenica TaxID=278026 RepID=A0AAN7WI69_9SACH|nr:hypothetical protein RI543_002050 [Kazachstania heterogenica]